MMNISLVSLSVVSLFSVSPIYSINRYYQGRVTTEIFDSYFSHSFQNVIYSNTMNHKTYLHKDTFTHTLNSALMFVSEAEEPKESTILKNQDFGNGRKYFTDYTKNGNITIAGCKFSQCSSGDDGGALYVGQDGSIILHETIFDQCTCVKDGAGGYICKSKGNRIDEIGSITIDIKDELMKSVDSQYCCFQKCKAPNNEEGRTGFGSSLLIAGENVKLYYTSATEEPDSNKKTQARGAQFDIQSNHVESQYVNSTYAHSKFCAAIEYRYAKSGKFNFQTIMNGDSMFSTSFTEFPTNFIVNISYCNLIDNDLKEYEQNSLTYPALIHVRRQDMNIEHFVFLRNNHNNVAKFVSREQQTGESFACTIWLRYCYAADKNSDIGDEAFQTENCNLNTNPSDLKLNEFELLSLGECEGKKTAGVIVITQFFTPSGFFSKSSVFSETDAFSKTYEFSNSDKFSNSGKFSKSNDFTESLYFGATTPYFSESKKFSPSDDFVQSYKNRDIIPDDSDKGGKLGAGPIAGIAVGAAALVAIIVALVVFLIKKKHVNIDEEEVETLDGTKQTTNTDNPIYNKTGNDDPFQEDFDN